MNRRWIIWSGPCNSTTMATPLQEPRPRGRSARRKPLNLSLDIEPSVTGEGADSPEPSAAAAADPSLSHDEKMALEQLTQNFESSIFEQPQKHKYSSFSNSLALQLNAEAEARGYPTSAYNSLPGHSEGTSDLSSLSSSSRSDSEDSFLLQGHLPSFYSDATPQGSASTLTLLDPSPSSPSWSQRAYAEQGASLNSRPAIALDAQATIQPTTESEQPYDEEDSRMLSFPLKVCAYALALLPIPTSLLSTRSRTQSPPPLPVEVHESPKICRVMFDNHFSSIYTHVLTPHPLPCFSHRFAPS